jgi:hypothetical protein
MVYPVYAGGFARAARAQSSEYLHKFWVDDVLYSGVFGRQVSVQCFVSVSRYIICIHHPLVRQSRK